MKRIIVMAALLALVATAPVSILANGNGESPTVITGSSGQVVEVRLYVDFEGDYVYICKDGDGYLAWFRDYEGSTAYGTGYQWSDVEEDYKTDRQVPYNRNWTVTDCVFVYENT